ncbi:MAG TPA: 6-phosphogluconolactonase [Oculatellaceae cyanobacterium]
MNSGKRDEHLQVYDTDEKLVEALAEHIYDLSKLALETRGQFTVSLSGGSTPKVLYEYLADAYAKKMSWGSILWFLGDERCVPHTSEESNYRMIDQALFSKAPVPRSNVFATEGQDTDPKASASHYEALMRQVVPSRSNEIPCFDLILLGLGPDGHTASLFPGSAALKEQDRCFVANWVEKFNAHRLTTTYPVLNNARNVIFLASGKGKAQILNEVLNSPDAGYPAQKVQPTPGRLQWFVDKAAVELLNTASSTR